VKNCDCICIKWTLVNYISVLICNRIHFGTHCHGRLGSWK